jgi:hypothetical protein
VEMILQNGFSLIFPPSNSLYNGTPATCCPFSQPEPHDNRRDVSSIRRDSQTIGSCRLAESHIVQRTQLCHFLLQS